MTLMSTSERKVEKQRSGCKVSSVNGMGGEGGGAVPSMHNRECSRRARGAET